LHNIRKVAIVEEKKKMPQVVNHQLCKRLITLMPLRMLHCTEYKKKRFSTFFDSAEIQARD